MNSSSQACFVQPPRPAGLGPNTWFHNPAHRSYSFLHFTEMVKTVELERGGGPVFAFRRDDMPGLLDAARVTVDHEKFPYDGQPISVREVFALTSMRGVIVVRDGCIVYESYPGMEPTQRHAWMSISKSAMNMLLGHLDAAGVLDWNRSVDAYVPELNGCGYGPAPLRQLADMQVAVDIDEKDYNSPTSSFWKWGGAIGWFEPNEYTGAGVKALLRTARQTGEDTVDKVFYTGATSQVLGWVIEAVSGKPLVEIFESVLWRHVGAEMNAAVSVDVHGVPFVGGGWCSTLRDLARYGLIWAHDGKAPDGTRVFSEHWLADHTRGQGPVLSRDVHYHNHSYSRGHGLAHQGHSGQMLWANPRTRTVVACFGAVLHPNGQEPWTIRAQLRAAEAIDDFLNAPRGKAD